MRPALERFPGSAGSTTPGPAQWPGTAGTRQRAERVDEGGRAVTRAGGVGPGSGVLASPGLYALRRSIRLVVLVAVACMLAAWAFPAGGVDVSGMPPASAYRATTVLRVDPEALESSAYVSSLLTGGVVPARVADRLGVAEGALLDEVEVQPNQGNTWLGLEIIDQDPVFAHDALVALSQELVSFLAEQRVLRRDETAATLRTEINDVLAAHRAAAASPVAPEISGLRERLSQLETDTLRAQLTSVLGRDVSSPASIERSIEVVAWSAGGNTEPTPTTTRVAAAGLVGAAVSVLLVLLVGVADTRLRSPAAVAAAAGAPLLVAVADPGDNAMSMRPVVPLLLAAAGPGSPTAVVVTAWDEDHADLVAAALTESLSQRVSSRARQDAEDGWGATVRRVPGLLGPGASAAALEPQAPTVVVVRVGSTTTADLRQLLSVLVRHGAVVVGVVVTGTGPAGATT